MTITILDCLVEDLRTRQLLLRGDRNPHTHYLKELDPNDLLQKGYGAILAGLQKKSGLTEIVVAIGSSIRRELKLSVNSVIEAQTGWFICVSFLEMGVLGYKLKDTYKNGKRAKHQSYHLIVTDWDAVKYLWTLIDRNKVSGIFPMREPPAKWEGPTHENGTQIVKKMHSSLLKIINSTDQPILFKVLNKLSQTGWRINRETFTAFQQAMQQSSKLVTKDSPFKFAKEIEKDKRSSLLREAEAIQSIATSYLNDTFYHMYNFDFRGRTYVNTAYLHEQSSDNAKGILNFSESVPLGEHGYFWLAVHTANCYGNDKCTLQQAYDFVNNNLVKFIDFAKDPMLNREWMQVDAPFSFLACCHELKSLMEWVMAGNSIETKLSNGIGYFDGSTNGTQHLCAMSLDETIAHLVNLVPTELPGDLYMYIAGYVWENLEAMGGKLTNEERNQFDSIFEMARKLHKDYSDAPRGSEQKQLAYAAVSEWRNNNKLIRTKLFPIYWLAVKNPKDHRKIVKRGCMTLGYGASSFGMGQ